MKKESGKTRKFLNLPSYPGGREALVKFLIENQVYPDEARKNNIEGIVHISFDVDHYGEVSRERIIRGLGYGCDEEAARLVKLLKYNSTYNRGARVKKTMKLKIPFTMKPENLTIMYNYVDEKPEVNDSSANDGNTSYTYTIRF